MELLKELSGIEICIRSKAVQVGGEARADNAQWSRLLQRMKTWVGSTKLVSWLFILAKHTLKLKKCKNLKGVNDLAGLGLEQKITHLISAFCPSDFWPWDFQSHDFQPNDSWPNDFLPSGF